MAEDRPALLLHDIDRSSRILELGPSMSPMAPRSAGWNVTVVDHASQEELIEKYRHDVNVNVANIEKVDHVWKGGALHDAVPRELHGTFDVFIASHVIEHIPDPVGFLASVAKLLNPAHGILALAIPDKRWCFDYFKQVSTTGQMLDAHRAGAQRHSATTRFDASAYVAFDGNRSSWGREPLPNIYLPDTLEHAYSEFEAWSPDPNAPYVDCHAWHFTPASFELLILELGAVGVSDWHISWLSPRPTVEFFARLKRGRQHFVTPSERDQRRLDLMKQVLLDLREQTDWLVNSNSGSSLLNDEVREELRQVAETSAMLRNALPLLVGDEAKAERRQLMETAAMVRAALPDLVHQSAETDAMVQTALRPARAVWHRALPLRKAVARLRGRI